MLTVIKCPHCNHTFSIEGEAAETAVQCPSCRISIPTSEEVISPSKITRSLMNSGPVQASRSPSNSIKALGGTDANFMLTGIAALGITVLVYTILFMPLKNTPLGELYVNRGWVPYVIVCLTAWAGCILIVKTVKLHKQKKHFTKDLLPNQISENVTRDNAFAFCDHIRNCCTRTLSHFLPRRLLIALEHFKSRGEVSEIINIVDSQAGIDAATVESSYSLIRVLIWAIPILGFIGTVSGIGRAVGGFSTAVSGAQEFDVIKSELGNVTTGLAFAFDTTFIALVHSIFIMFPSNWLQKTEDTLLSQVDDYCTQKLLRRMDDMATDSGLPEILKQVVSEASLAQTSALKEWVTHIREMGTQVRSDIVAGWGDIDTRMQQLHQQQLGDFKTYVGHITNQLMALTTEREKHQGEQIQQCSRLVETVRETAARTQQEIVTMQRNQIHGMQDVVAVLKEDFQSLQQGAQQTYTSLVEKCDAKTQQFMDTLSGTMDQVCSVQKETASYLQEVGSTVHKQIGQLTQRLDTALDSNVSSLYRIQNTITESVDKLTSHMEDVRSVHVTQTTDATQAFRDAMRSLLIQTVKKQDEHIKVFQQIAASFTEDTRSSQSVLSTTRKAYEATVDTTQKRLLQVESDIQGRAKKHLALLSKATAHIVTVLPPAIIKALEAERESGVKSSVEHLARVSKFGNKMVASLVDSQQKLDQHITALLNLFEGQQRLTAMQQTLGSNLELLATSDSFKQTLNQIGTSLNRVSVVLETIEQKGHLIQPETDGPPSRGLMQWFRRGNDHA